MLPPSNSACTDPDWSGDCLLLKKDGTRTNDLCNENSESYGVARCISGDHQGEFVCTDVDPEGQCNGTVVGAFVDLAPGYLADIRNASRASATASPPLAAQETVSVTTTVTPTSKITPIPAAPPAPIPCPSETGEKAAIGAGIGVPLAAALTAALLWAIWERRLRKKAQRTGYLVDIHENGAMTAIRS
ncbi:MAG: hypothetical protein LQ342_003129 [Letrouitia transgressa]|nr:MAG: hypothetical protein LQ342_003129 [Letrouitia transgressa]